MIASTDKLNFPFVVAFDFVQRRNPEGTLIRVRNGWHKGLAYLGMFFDKLLYFLSEQKGSICLFRACEIML